MSGTAYSAKIQPRRVGWSIEILHWPTGCEWVALAEVGRPWALSHRGAIRKATRVLRRRRAAEDRRIAKMEVFP